MPKKRISGLDPVAPPVAPASRVKRNNPRTKHSPSTLVESAASVARPSEANTDEIARLAYSYWEARGYQGGSPEEDWLRAEQELRAGRVASAAKA